MRTQTRRSTNLAAAAMLILALAIPALAEDAKDAKDAKGKAKEASPRQWVEGFDEVEFHHNANRGAAARDFRGMAPGFMTAGWWAPGQMKKNLVSWKTAAVPEKRQTTFAFIASTSVLPPEMTRGP